MSRQISAALELGSVGRAVIETMPVGVLVFDNRLYIVEANKRAGELIELGQYVDGSLAQGTPSVSREKWAAQIKNLFETKRCLTWDGVNYTRGHKSGPLRIVCRPMKSVDTAEIVGGVMTIEDVSELVDLQTRLADAQHLAAVGRLASKVAHELNNPLDGILRYINLAIRAVEGQRLEKPAEYLEQCRKGLSRMVRIVSDLLVFARRGHPPLEIVRITDLIDEAIKDVGSRDSAAKVEIRRDYQDGVPEVRAGNLYQVFNNLVKNAFDAMPNGGRLEVATRVAGDMIVVEFADTGIGFSPDDAEAIFEPFYTTKQKDQGTGLGLAVCKDIIDRCGGRIAARNATGGGSIFAVYLPVQQGAANHL